MKIQLVVPSLDERYVNVSRLGLFPPLGLLSIGSYLKKYLNSEVDVEILDGTIMGMNEIEKKINANFVGISVSVLTYRSAFKLAKIAKERIATTIIGGAHVFLLEGLMLENRDYFDYVIRGEGEKAFYEIVMQKSPEEIKNLVFREQGGVIKNRVELLDLDSLPLIDRRLVDMRPYWANYRRQRPNSPFKYPNIIYSQKGCRWRKENGACVFCGRSDPGWRPRSPKNVWQEIEYLVKEWNADYIWDVCGSFLSYRQWFKEFIDAKSKDINPAFEIYARADEIDERTAYDLAKLNVYKVFIGIDAGDSDTLLTANKGTTTEQNIKAVRLLKNVGIKVTMGMVIGMPGENERTLSNTITHAQRIMSLGNVETISCAVLIPVPNSKAFRMLINHSKYQRKYRGKDDLDVAELQKDWASAFCEVDYECLEEVSDYILSLAPIKSTMGKIKRIPFEYADCGYVFKTGEIGLEDNRKIYLRSPK